MDKVLSNTTPLIALADLNQLDLLHKLSTKNDLFIMQSAKNPAEKPDFCQTQRGYRTSLVRQPLFYLV